MSENIYTAFLEMQKELPTIEKDGTVSIPTKKGSMKFKYATLETIHKVVKPILHKHGFSLAYIIEVDRLTIQLSREDTSIRSAIKFEPLSDPKQTGSLITYYKRYLITALLALDTDEDLDVQPFEEKPKKAKMTEKAFEQAQERIVNGEKGVLNKCLAFFDLTQDQHDRILNLDLEHNG